MYIPSVDTPRDTDRTDSGNAPASSNAVEAVPAVGCTSSPALSFVSRAKAVLHSAASRAKVFTESRAESRNDRGGDGKAKKDTKKADDQECSGDDGFIKSREEIPEAFSSAAQDAYDLPQKLSIPPASILKQLTAAYDRNGNDFFYSKDLLSLVENPLPTKEKPGLSFSSVKSLVLGEKDEKLFSDLSNDVELLSMMQLLFDSEKSYTQTNGGLDLNNLPLAFLPKDIRGAPPGSFVFKLSEIIGGFSSIHKMSAFWGYVIAELRRRWSKGFPIPWMPLDADPDLDSCPLHQQLQVINCCISRKLRRNAAIKSLESVIRKARVENKDLVDTSENANSIRYARLVSGQYALRLGADHLSENLNMLETGEPIYSPVTQEGPILTEELIKENEELVLRTGSFGAGCSQLLSDMQAFKAANPGCVLEDFIRWHSPPDWTEIESTSGANDSTGKEGSSRRGRLSKRMLQEGNLWQELWKSAKALPAVQQTPVFDEDLAVESIFTTLEDIRPSELIEQLFLSMLCSAFAIVEASISPDSHVSRTFHECKDWVIAACQSGISSENIGDICKVYETVEMLITHPEEAITVTNQPEEATTGEPKSRFKRMNLNFIAKKPSKDEKKSEERQMRVFSQLFDTKYLFPKRQPKLKPASTSEPMPDVNDWTIV